MAETDQRHDKHPTPPMVGDHLAMDLLNTQAQENDATIDYWTRGEDVLDWLAHHGIVPPSGAGPVDFHVLLVQAQALRAVARDAITRRKRGEPVDVGGLNAYLEGHLTAPRLRRTDDGQLVLEQMPRGAAIPALLGPVAQAVAELLVDGDFDLVRQCEHPECILWFYDRTKAHKRRWCSMAVCGNRFKAAQFRKRTSEAAGAHPESKDA